MTNYIDKPDSEYTYQDWLAFVQTNTPEDVARDMLQRRRNFDDIYRAFIGMVEIRDQTKQVSNNLVAVVRTWQDVKIEIENPMSMTLRTEGDKQVASLVLSHSQIDLLRDLLIALHTDIPESDGNR